MKLNVTSAAALCAAAAATFAVAGCGSSDNSSSGSSSSDTTTAAQAPPPSTSGSSGSSGGSSAGGGASSNLKLSADPSGQLKFDKSKLSAKAGNVTITMDNPSPVAHAVAVEGNGVDKDGATVTMGGKSTVTVNLKPGTYEFYCPVDGHKAAGMKGVLTVK
jgi:plastocyanin